MVSESMSGLADMVMSGIWVAKLVSGSVVLYIKYIRYYI